ncbi:hypothetical protein P152DRAFT_48877 [Eremomyces bilateralis CBS 781.70]|uniref:RGS domain-containing protein n=1 Tax=Eremomyces bilateralis CBS 781.70 TaxID=1392243 RepID=A0A6G1G0Y6_9PEZI|nr:uncharacterized protein P152DRAFT_48877 [Eremomyces bilateralis CBS 781.70]KAF1811703.1 hypothetical protein P152DRAFT_48877 [Eremomyces bilateralis CBS 781.70]
MASLIRREGHDFGEPNLNGLGVFYICLSLLYTIFVLGGLWALWLHRDTTAVRIRGFWTIFSAVLCIHMYSMAVVLVYPLNGILKCGTEFWMMSIVLPFSVALFQASNIRLSAYYEGQRSLINSPTTGGRKARYPTEMRGLLRWWREQNSATKTYVFIALGLTVQLFVTLFLFFGSRRFHGSYGFFSRHVGPADCCRGYEWIPSVFWQFLWASVFGPYVLLRIRYIRDVHYWAWQTRLAIIAALPGTPLWLAFVYSDNPRLMKVSKSFVPAGWFLPGLITMQFVSIYFPLHDAHNKSQRPSSPQSVKSTMTKSEKKDVYSLASLELQIAYNINPLLKWTAEKEFTAENIVFLKAVRDFKRKWAVQLQLGLLDPEQLRDRYEEAALIFFTLVNPQTARFNINIDYHTYKELSWLFVGLRYVPFEDNATSRRSQSENVITPWSNERRCSMTSEDIPSTTDVDRLYPIPVTEIEPAYVKTRSDTTLYKSGDTIRRKSTSVNPPPIPAQFTVAAFDKAYESVKDDVFRNTWVRFVDSGETASIADSELTDFSFTSMSSYLSKLKRAHKR